MILRDCTWQVPEPRPPEATPQPKKRRMTPAMKAANKRNAQLSTGPKTSVGRETASRNAVSHGMTCTKEIFLASESPEKFKADLVVWSRQLGAKTEPEIAQVSTALYNLVKVERADRAEVCAVNEAVDKINDTFDDQKQAEVQQWILDLPENIKETHAKLMGSTAGCAWLLSQFNVLSVRLSTYPTLDVSQRAFALQLGGHNPKDLFRDPVVWGINKAYFGAIGAPEGFTAEGVGEVLQHDGPFPGISPTELVRRLELMVIDLPTVAEGHQLLQDYVQEWIDRLTERKGLIQFREDRDRANAVGKAELDASAEGDKRKRHANASTRISQSSIRLLFTMKQERRKYGEEDLDDPGPEDGPAATLDSVESEQPEGPSKWGRIWSGKTRVRAKFRSSKMKVKTNPW